MGPLFLRVELRGALDDVIEFPVYSVEYGLSALAAVEVGEFGPCEAVLSSVDATIIGVRVYLGD